NPFQSVFVGAFVREARRFSSIASPTFCRLLEDKIMAGGNFMHRVMSYLVNELIVNSLANSPSFQRFAVRTSKRIEEVSSKAAQKQQELAGRMKDLSKDFESFKNQ
ncbi:hypothetical protein F2P56_008311, partial [Juglans regia]